MSMRGTTEYRAYYCIKTRCTNPKHESYYMYGAAGIECRFSSFEEFYAAIGPKPEPKRLYSVDRWPNAAGHYEPGNVRWATAKQQAANRKTRTRATHCKRGHLLSVSNVYVDNRGRRSCKRCKLKRVCLPVAQL